MYVRKLDTSKLETPDGEKKILIWKAKITKIKEQVADRMSPEYQKATGAMEFSYMLKKYKVRRGMICHIPLSCSNAFYKKWEIMNWLNYDLEILDGTGATMHFDNAAFPGDFLRAVEIYNTGIRKVQSSWLANSLLPEGDEKVLGDRYKLYEHYPDRWVMNCSDSSNVNGNQNQNSVLNCSDSSNWNGDVRDLSAINEIAPSLLDRKINIYSSDLGIPFEDRFREEEEHFEANLGQIYLGLKILQPGGIFVVKMFSMFNTNVRQLVSYIASLFESTYILKPKTSKPDNSEMYVCGINYQPQGDITPAAIAETKLIQLSRIVADMTYRQINKLRDNIKKYDSGSTRNLFPFSTITAWLSNQKLISDDFGSYEYRERDSKGR